jgi:phage-related protein
MVILPYSEGVLADKPVVWIGTARDDVSAMPAPVKGSFGHRLRLIQRGKPALDMKALPRLGAGVFELRERHDGEAYRMMYVVNLERAIYVLHAFVKKSKSGIGLPRPDAALIAQPLKRARMLDAVS